MRESGHARGGGGPLASSLSSNSSRSFSEPPLASTVRLKRTFVRARPARIRATPLLKDELDPVLLPPSLCMLLRSP